MIIITVGICFLSYFVRGFYEFQINNYWCFYTFLGISMAITIVIMICGDGVSGFSQGFKYVLLLIFTLCYGYIISFCTSVYAEAYGAPLVLEAMILTSAMCGALTLYAFIVKQDIKTLVAILIVVIICMILFAISFAFTMSDTLHTLYATFGCIFGGIILIIDTNFIADGDRGCSLDDPVLGALIIYIDIMRIFLYILQAMGSKKN
jgi:protein lifeguard